MGLFQQAKFRPVAGMLINLVVSVALANRLGIVGVLIGTVVSDWTTVMWFDPFIIHKYGYNKEGRDFSVSVYFRKLFRDLLISCVMGIADYIICRLFLTGMGWISVIAHAIICGITVPCALLAASIKTQEGQYVYHMIEGTFKKVLRLNLK